MRLKRIEAVRFGRLVGCTLGDLGEGLTVVTGPNEAGKSTFTHLVRYMLYGFPTEASKQQPPFLSPAGDREGRLVFEEGDSEWVVTRTHGPHGGPTVVKALSGADRTDLLGEITRGVSQAEYRVVFGFGLDELAEIERERGSEDDIISRLYAAGAGITISPQAVRSGIEKRASELFAPRGKNREINTVLREIRDRRGQIRDLEREAQEYADSVASLGELGRRVDAARETRDAAMARASAAVHDFERVADLREELSGLAGELDTLDATLTETRERRDNNSPDEQVIAADSRILALLEDVSAARERRERVASLSADIKKQEAAVAATLQRIGLGEADTGDVDLGPETLAGLEGHKRRITALESERSLAEKDLARREDALRRLGSAPPTPSTGKPSARAGIGLLLVSVVLALMGVGSAAIGFSSGDSSNHLVAIGLGVIAAVVAVIWWLGRPSSAPAQAPESTAPVELDHQAAKDELERIVGAHESAVQEWRTWLSDRSLDSAGDDPEAVSILVSELKGVQSKREMIAQSQAQLDGELATLGAFTRRVAELASTLVPGSGEVSDERALELCARLASVRDLAMAKQAERDRAEIELRAVMDRVESLRKRQTGAQEAIAAILAARNVDDMPALEALRDCEAADAKSAADAFEQIKSEFDRLSASLDSEGRARDMTEARLVVAGLKERLNTLSGEYAVLRLAMRLLDEARSRYERERQPEVIREAEAVFSKITGGRYERLTVPLSDGRIEVFDKASAAKPTSVLSRGTAEQLYLALRIALIRQMGDVGCSLPIIMDDIFVNFDEERRQGAVEAVVDLARTRQVIVFTCHPDTAARFAAVADHVTTLTLDRC